MQIKIAALGSILTVAIAAAPAPAQTREEGTHSTLVDNEIRVIGCVQWEKDYRQARNEGRGGVLGTGVGTGDEFLLNFARAEGPGAKPAAAVAAVGTGGTGADQKLAENATYSITGDREKELGRRVGQQVEVIGTLEQPGNPNSERASDLPRVKMTAWVPLKDVCPH